MTTIALSDLVPTETKEAIYARALATATGLGLPVTTWTAGDPTRSLYHHMAETLEVLEARVAEYAASGFLDLCSPLTNTVWLKLLAEQLYGYIATEATYATCTVLLTNAGGGVYEPEPGDITIAKAAGETYHNTTGGTLSGSSTLSLTFAADLAGSDSSAAIGEITTMVTTLLGVTCSNTTTAVGADEESPASIVTGCRATLGALSPNGPADAYHYVATNEALTGTTGVTRTLVLGDSTTGDVTVYLAGPSGTVTDPDVVLVQAAIETWAAPLCITATAVKAGAVSIDVTYQLWIYDSVGLTDVEIETAIEIALAAMLASRPIGGDKKSAGTGYIYTTMIESTIRSLYPTHAFALTSSTPAGDTALTNSQVAVLGTVSSLITQEPRP